MKPERAFTAQRAAAVHCPELTGRGLAPAALLPQLSQVGEPLAAAICAALTPLAGAELSVAACHPARDSEDLLLGAEVGPLASCLPFALGPGAVPALLTIEGAAVLGWLDRTFGGSGKVPAILPERLPLSAELLVDRIALALTGCLAEAFSSATPELVAPLPRLANIAAFAPLAAGASFCVLKFELTEDGRPPLAMTFIVEQEHLPTLLGEGGAGQSRRVRGRADPLSEPFAGVPLQLSAVLVDMRISMATIAGIEPGMVLPVAVARNVPVKLGGKVIAHGSVGASDDCVAIRITQTSA